MLKIAGFDADYMIEKYNVTKKDDDAGSGTSETGVDWRQRRRAGKTTIKVTLSGSDDDFAALGTLIAAESFPVEYVVRGASATGTFKLSETSEDMDGEGYWVAEYIFEEF